MNIQTLKTHQKMLAVMFGVAILATTGLTAVYAETNSTQTNTQNQPPQIQGSINLQQMIQSSIQTKFSAAADTAASAITNGKVIAGGLTVKQGYIVYSFQVIDDKNMVYSVIVDAANGSVLYKSDGHQAGIGGLGGFGMGHGGMKTHKFHAGGPTGSLNNQQPPTTTTPSSGTLE